MSVQVEVNESDGSYVLIFTDPLAMVQYIGGATIVLDGADALALHEQLGKEIGCVDCSCIDYGYEQRNQE